MKKYVAEAIGTAVLVILGCGTAMLVGCDAAAGSGYLLTALVAVAYLLSYILLQMETYALISGTLLLFALLVGIMYLTSNLNKRNAPAGD